MVTIQGIKKNYREIVFNYLKDIKTAINIYGDCVILMTNKEGLDMVAYRFDKIRLVQNEFGASYLEFRNSNNDTEWMAEGDMSEISAEHICAVCVNNNFKLFSIV